jgi:AcrR family transcriptional regulator
MATKDETRQMIIEAAESLFTRFGPTKTSVADIARKIGMSPANIYNFYPSRDAILEAVGQINLTALRERLAAETQATEGDWPKIRNLFLQNARQLRQKLANETDVLHLQALEAQHKWKFISDYNGFLMMTVQTILSDAMAAGRIRKQDPSEATTALFDCMLSALDPLQLRKFDELEHERRITSQLALLERAFK